jgi:hypothetical protein
MMSCDVLLNDVLLIDLWLGDGTSSFEVLFIDVPSNVGCWADRI